MYKMVSGLETVNFPLLEGKISKTGLQQVQKHTESFMSVPCGAAGPLAAGCSGC